MTDKSNEELLSALLIEFGDNGIYYSATNTTAFDLLYDEILSRMSSCEHCQKQGHTCNPEGDD